MEIVTRNGKAREEIASLEKRSQQLVEEDNRKGEASSGWRYT